MRSDKLKSYNLKASIHTFNVKSYQEPKYPTSLKMESFKPSYMKNSESWFTIINPNKTENGDIFAYSEFCALTQKLFNEAQIPDCTFWRTDIRLDSYEDNFKAYYKLNLLLISLFSILFHDPNKQAIGHFLMSSKEFTDITTKNSYWEVKYYNKKFQTHDTDPAKARLEFRCLKGSSIREYKPHKVKEMWFKKLDNIIEHLDKLEKRCNAELFEAYKEFCRYNEHEARNRDLLTKFFSIYAHSMTVFSRKQLRDFFTMCGIENNKIDNRIEYIYDNTQIEFISKSDLKKYVFKIKECMEDFFSC